MLEFLKEIPTLIIIILLIVLLFIGNVLFQFSISIIIEERPTFFIVLDQYFFFFFNVRFNFLQKKIFVVVSYACYARISILLLDSVKEKSFLLLWFLNARIRILLSDSAKENLIHKKIGETLTIFFAELPHWIMGRINIPFFFHLFFIGEKKKQ